MEDIHGINRSNKVKSDRMNDYAGKHKYSLPFIQELKSSRDKQNLISQNLIKKNIFVFPQCL